MSSSVNPTNLVGPGTLVVNGDQSFGKSVTIGNDINIYVDGDLYIDKNASLGDNVHIYVSGNATIRKENGTVFGTGEGCSLLVEGSLGIKKALVFQGLIFSGGQITTDKDLTVSGTMIAGDGFWLKKSAEAKFNAGVLPQDYKEKMILSTYFVQHSSWNELPAN